MLVHQKKHYHSCKKKLCRKTVWYIGICTKNNELQVAKFSDQMYRFIQISAECWTEIKFIKKKFAINKLGFHERL